MGQILDQFGAPARFSHGATRSRFRGVVYDRRNESIDELVPEYDRETLVSLSKRLFLNLGVPRGAILQKADYSVGEAWIPKYSGPDQENGKAAEDWLNNEFFPNCDVRGGVHDWHQFLRLVSISIDRDADAFILLTTEGGMPKIQHLSEHLVKTKINETIVSEGPYEGRKITKGIITNKRGKPLAYRVSTGQRPDEYTEIPARAVNHLFDPSWSNQGRGLPAFTHAIEDLVHSLKSTEDERTRQQMLSSIGLIEHNELGGPDLSDPSNYILNTSTASSDLVIRDFNAGKTKYFQSGSGGKLEQIKHDNPGPIWEAFQDRLIRSAIAGVGWSYSLAWKPTGQGTAERAEIEKARRSVSQRQSLLWHLAKKIVTYAVSVASDQGVIPYLTDPTKWNFSLPPRLTVDDGRELKSMLDAWRSGAVNMSEVVESRGDDYVQHCTKRANEIAIREKARLEAEKEHGVSIDPREMAMLTPNEQPQTNSNND